MSEKTVRVHRRIEIVRELCDAGRRQYVDVTAHVVRFGTITKTSTLGGSDWEIPGHTFSVTNGDVDGYFTPGRGSSVWSQLGVEPEECWTRVTLWVVLANGSREIIDTYFGKIVDLIPKINERESTIDIVTRMAQDEGLSTKIDKNTGDDLVIRDGAF